MLSGEENETGAPNDGFLKYIENTSLAIHKNSTFSSTEMHPKWRYKTCF